MALKTEKNLQDYSKASMAMPQSNYLPIWLRIVLDKEIVSVCNMYVHKIRGKSHMTLHFSFLMAKYSVCKY